MAKLSIDPGVHPNWLELVTLADNAVDSWKFTTVPAVGEGQANVGVALKVTVTTFPSPIPAGRSEPGRAP